MKRLLCALPLAILFSLGLTLPQFGLAGGQDKGKVPADSRLKPAKTLNDYFPFTPPKSKEAWEKRKQEVKEQVLVANGLWPMPKKTPLNAVIHGKIKRAGYTIEKVYFESHPGHFVTGNLYRPTDVEKGKKVPGILCPHGHWANGRFYEAGAAAVKRDMDSKAEKTEEGAKYPLQARCANLAMMGCVVFHYDMVGYADSNQIKHREGFKDPEATLRLQNFMGLQTWNSIRALDFLLSLKEVDSSRIGVTGASGGGTQTFILTAVDDRPAAAFPAVMVSTAMQGGCVCENCEYLRVGTGNIELAGVFAPKPLAMSGANDWTKEIETKGLPQLKALYKLYGAEDKVDAKAFVQFPHNYNQVAREMMYNWFNKHFKLGLPTPVVERPFIPVPPKELSVFDGQHPLPKHAKNVRELRDYLTAQQKQQLQEMFPKDAAKLKDFQRVIGTALRVMMVDKLPDSKEVAINGEALVRETSNGDYWQSAKITRVGAGEVIPAKFIKSKEFNGSVVVWIHPEGIASLEIGGKLNDTAKGILKKGSAILAIDAFGTGAFKDAKLPAVDKNYAGFTFGYNRTLLANRVHDILTAVAYAHKQPSVKKVNLVGIGEAGPWVALARGLCGDAVSKTAADLDQFRFAHILDREHQMMQPGALKYGGMPALVALSAPHSLYLHNTQGVDSDGWIAAAYQAAGSSGNLQQQAEQATMEQVVGWLMK